MQTVQETQWGSDGGGSVGVGGGVCSGAAGEGYNGAVVVAGDRTPHAARERGAEQALRARTAIDPGLERVTDGPPCVVPATRA